MSQIVKWLVEHQGSVIEIKRKKAEFKFKVEFGETHPNFRFERSAKEVLLEDKCAISA